MEGSGGSGDGGVDGWGVVGRGRLRGSRGIRGGSCGESWPFRSRAGGLCEGVVGIVVASAHVLDEVGCDVLLALDGGTAVLAVGFDVAVGLVDLVRGYVEVLDDDARRLDRRKRAGLRVRGGE